MNFKDQYKSPLWQKKRLEALEHYGFACQSCESTENQLHVHHRRYIKGRMIWEYGLEEFQVLCAECHEDAHKDKDLFDSIVVSAEIVSYMDLAALTFNFLHPFDTGEQQIFDGLNCYDPKLMAIGKFAGMSIDFLTADIKTILRLSPDDFHDLAEYMRGK